MALDVGLWVRECAFVQAHDPCSRIDPYSVGRFALRQAADRLMGLMPSSRNAILLRLAPRVGDAGSTDVPPGLDPSVTAVLAVRRGGEALRTALTTLADQDYPTDRYEVIVVHDGGSADVSETVRAVASRTSVPIRELVASPPEGPAARNSAMAVATGDICAHTDDACRVPGGWARTIARGLFDGAGVITGPVIEEPDGHPSFLVLPGTRLRWEHQGIYPASNAAYRRRAALALGGFDASAADQSGHIPLGWDTDLAWRLQRRGWRGRYLKDMFLYRRYFPPRPLTWIREEWLLARDLPRVVARIPELEGRLLAARRFAGYRTLLFDLLVGGLALSAASRRRRWLLLAGPWIVQYGTYLDAWPPARWIASARLIAALGLRHTIWLAGLVSGSIRAGRVVL
jgi:cellulose synthase/poly-beta-1,6-N-acetylglucosamine synthase-like glycosyltransferase